MIKVKLNRQNFQYDVHSLVKAFYPEHDVKVVCTVPDSDQDPEYGAAAAAEADDMSAIFLLTVYFSGEDGSRFSCLSINLYSDGQICSEENEKCDESNRQETKNKLKRMLYRILSAYSGKVLPWGNLTGVRPVKIPAGLIEQGWNDEEISSYMQNTYYTSAGKTSLAIDIARREHALLDSFDISAKGYSIYVGIPFCPSICLYCSFSSSPIALWQDKVDAYMDALCHEIDEVSMFLPDRRPDTIYIGGGTPTTLSPSQMDRLLSKLEEKFRLDYLKEFTVEAGRPDSITREKLKILKDHKIRRISVNPQTMNQHTLDFIGRRHTTEQTKEAFYLAREMGFDNINMDLIVGLPGEHKPEVENTMRSVTELDPECITVHSLAVKRAARLRLFKEEHKELTLENNNEIMDMTAAYAGSAGLYPYYLYRQKNMAGNFENVGYAKEGYECLYNILMMEEVQTVVAFGAGAATKEVFEDGRIERIENVKDIKNYIERIDEMIERKRVSALRNGGN